jgi:hypothetical protein
MRPKRVRAESREGFVTTCIALREDQWKRIALLSLESGMVKTEIVRQAVDFYFRERREQERKAKRVVKGRKAAAREGAEK